MKWFHNDKVSLTWAIFVELVAHLFFAFQAFLLGGFLGDIALKTVFGDKVGTQIGAWGLAIFIFGAAFQAFVLGDYMAEHVEAFENTAKGTGKYRASWKQIKWLVAGLEISSLAFRCAVVLAAGDWQQALIILAFGTISLWYAFAQARVIHASVNRPVEHDVYRARQAAGREIVIDAMKQIPQMSAEQKRRFYQGDLGTVDEVQSTKWQRENEKVQSKEQKRSKQKQRDEERARDQDVARGYADQLLNGSKQQDQEPFLRALPNDQQANG